MDNSLPYKNSFEPSIIKKKKKVIPPSFNAIFIKIVCIVLFFFVSSLKSSGAEEKKIKSREPIHITSQEMVSHKKGKKIVFTGNVVTKQDKMTIYSNILEVYNDEKKNKIYKIVAIDNVKIENDGKHATGDKAVYFENKNTIELLGNATAWEKDNIIHGEKIIFDMINDTVKVVGNVNLTFYPDDKDKKTVPIEDQK